ncbi:hypothetical protein ADK70_04435 [Streptomyces rimosus subsp. pseudoverticillatus]|nr:hypothetical protein ADK70_04435 [Streptomyces rimosus subsp. pseudoverticillatus]
MPSSPHRLPGTVTTLPQVFEWSCDQHPHRIAVSYGTESVSYAELDARANRLARLLLTRGTKPGDRIGILLERSTDVYAALLGVLKTGAAYIPLDPSFPADRVAFIAEDARLSTLVTTSDLGGPLGATLPLLEIDRKHGQLMTLSGERVGIRPASTSASYIIYTSGTTGRPKGVVVSHANIVHFLRAATPLYQVNRQDRVYQGLSTAFDFSIEEIWPAWIAGATLVAATTAADRVGPGLARFLGDHRITVLCCVPTLLTTLDEDVPSLRTLLVSGEACPPDLVRRWFRPGRRILNAYGPTETTVTATCAELSPHRPVTIGTPLPGYEIRLLDEDLRPVGDGESGEICVGGPGVATGYLNRPELTAQRFISNPVEAERATTPRLYRTGDLGRYTVNGEIEYLGRIDTQVKIRGYRIELAEIEALLREDRAVENAVVTPLERDGTVHGLVGYITLNKDSGAQGSGSAHGVPAASRPEHHGELRERLRTLLRSRLPGYMIPSFLEVLPAFPLLTADKVDRKALPAPSSPLLERDSRALVAPETPLEDLLAREWAQALGLTELSVEDDFFCDLGGHSMTAARAVSRLRQEPGLSGLAVADLYAFPTVRSLAASLQARTTVPREEKPRAASAPPRREHSTLRVWTCGLSQVTALYAWLLLLGLPAVALLYRGMALWGFAIHAPAPGSVLGRITALDLGPFIALDLGWLAVSAFLLPVVGCRLLLAGVRPGHYPLWGVTYVRFWLHGKVLALSPLTLLAGSPLLPPVLRLLGATVGRGCHVSAMPQLPGMVRIGDDSSIGYGARLQPYAVANGWLRLAPVRIGSGSYIGTNSVVLPGACIGDGACVDHQSLIPADASVPAHEHWSGSPAVRQKSAPPLLEDMAEAAAAGDASGRETWSPLVLAGYALGALLRLLLPMLIAMAGAVLVVYAARRHGPLWAMAAIAVTGPGTVILTCLLVLAVKRAVMPAARPGIHRERSAFGVRKWIADGMMTLSLTVTHALYSTLYLVPFLRALGARTGRWAEVATVSFVDPDMLVIGAGSFVADTSVVGPAIFHRGRIALAPAEVGHRSFVGNGALLPGSCRTAENSLLGVHSVAPAQGIGPETAWLGSPALFLPRRQPSQDFPAKLTYNPSKALIAARLAIEYFRVTLPATITALAALGGFYLTARLAATTVPVVVFLSGPALLLGAGLFATLCAVVLKWLVIGRYRPRTEALWSIWVRRTEVITGLYENLVVPALLNLLTGTPWACALLRLFGVRIGRRVWLATTYLTEFDLVDVADDAAVDEFTSLQTHLFEDRVMKMSTVRIEAGATVGSRSVVLYDARVGRDTAVDALSLVMKAEALPDRTRWRGIPARTQ